MEKIYFRGTYVDGKRKAVFFDSDGRELDVQEEDWPQVVREFMSYSKANQ